MQTTESIDSLRVSTKHQTFCPDCGYELTGLPAQSRCPECGFHARQRLHGTMIDRIYARTVAIGIAILVYVVFDGIITGLISPFGSGQLGGALATMNFVGPKLWATTLMQRPLGHYPELPGVIGARTSILCLLAIWLITIKHPQQVVSEKLRLAARWYSVIAMGGMVGFTLGLSGYWPDEATGERTLCIGLVELPGTALLYLYLRMLADLVPGEERRRTLSTMCWLAPSVVLGGGLMMLVTFVHDYGQSRSTLMMERSSQAIGFAYGAMSMTSGMVAFLAVGSLGLAFASVGFARTARLIVGGRKLVAWMWRQLVGVPAERMREWGVIAGLLLLVWCALVGAENLSWYESRVGIGGNLPRINFPGPKFWLEFSSVRELVPCAIYNVLAVWLLTNGSPRASRCTRFTRWAAIAAAAGTVSLAIVTRGSSGMNWDYGQHTWNARDVALVTIFGELPITLLVYYRLAGLATLCGRADLRRQFFYAMAAVTLIIAYAMAVPLLNQFIGKSHRYSYPVLAICALHGMAAVTTAFWTSALVLKLAWAMYTRHRSNSTRWRDVVYLEVEEPEGELISG